jgi:hypothetical protein
MHFMLATFPPSFLLSMRPSPTFPVLPGLLSLYLLLQSPAMLDAQEPCLVELIVSSFYRLRLRDLRSTSSSRSSSASTAATATATNACDCISSLGP